MKKEVKYQKRVFGIIILILFSFFKSYADEIEQIYSNKNLSDRRKIDSIYDFYYIEKTPIEQIKVANKIISLATSNNDLLWLCNGFYLKGNAYYYMAETEKAYDNCLKSLEIAKKGNIKESLDNIYNSIANILSLNEEHDKAISYYKLASEIFLENNDSINAGYTTLNIVNEYNNIKNTDSVFFYLELASSIFSKHNDAYGMAYIFGHKALYFATIGKMDLAEKNLSIAINELKKVGQTYDILAFEFEMGKVLFDKGNLIKAKTKLLEVYKQSLLANFQEQARDATQLLSEINQKLGDYKNAHYYQSQYLAYKDSISNEESIRKMADLRAEYEISQKQIEVDYLEKKQAINKTALIIAFFILIILIILTYLLYRNNKIIKRQAKELEGLNATKDKMFSIISHDLRSPISSITGTFALIKELALRKDTGKLVVISDEITKSLHYINSLLDNLLNWATNQQGKIPYHPELFNIKKICIPLIRVFENSAKAKGVSLHLKVHETIQLFADRNSFETIFRNIIGNAVKFTNAGDNITLECKELPDKIQFSVTDTGVGIAEEKLPTIFELSNNKSTWGTANEKGVGLGLRLAYEFTVLNKGNISVKSKKGIGTTFYIEFPK